MAKDQAKKVPGGKSRSGRVVVAKTVGLKSGRVVEGRMKPVTPGKRSGVAGRVYTIETDGGSADVHIPVLDPKMPKPENKMTPYEKIELIEEGISKKALESLKEKANLDYDQLAQVLNVARATLINKKGKDKFNKDVSDKILGLADIYSYGYEVFEDRDRFNQWIFRSNTALEGQAPFDLLHSSFGREEVKNVIGRIDYGVYS